jgi:hypothetical protein
MKHAQPMPSLMLKTKLAQQTQPPRDFIGALREAVRARCLLHRVLHCLAVFAASCCRIMASHCAGNPHQPAWPHCGGEEGVPQPRCHPSRLRPHPGD